MTLELLQWYLYIYFKCLRSNPFIHMTNARDKQHDLLMSVQQEIVPEYIWWFNDITRIGSWHWIEIRNTITMHLSRYSLPFASMWSWRRWDRRRHISFFLSFVWCLTRAEYWCIRSAAPWEKQFIGNNIYTICFVPRPPNSDSPEYN